MDDRKVESDMQADMGRLRISQAVEHLPKCIADTEADEQELNNISWASHESNISEDSGHFRSRSPIRIIRWNESNKSETRRRPRGRRVGFSFSSRHCSETKLRTPYARRPGTPHPSSEHSLDLSNAGTSLVPPQVSAPTLEMPATPGVAFPTPPIVMLPFICTDSGLVPLVQSPPSVCAPAPCGQCCDQHHTEQFYPQSHVYSPPHGSLAHEQNPPPSRDFRPSRAFHPLNTEENQCDAIETAYIGNPGSTKRVFPRSKWNLRVNLRQSAHAHHLGDEASVCYLADDEKESCSSESYQTVKECASNSSLADGSAILATAETALKVIANGEPETKVQS